jgi:hypothetical protein
VERSFLEYELEELGFLEVFFCLPRFSRFLRQQQQIGFFWGVGVLWMLDVTPRLNYLP